jgi:hypothetical protein
LHGCGPSSGLFCANSNQVSKAWKMLTDLNGGKNTLSKSFDFCLLHLASFPKLRRHITITQTQSCRHWICSGQLRPSRGLSCRTPHSLIGADTDSEQDVGSLGLHPLDCGLYGHVARILCDMVYPIYLAVPTTDMEIGHIIPYNGRKTEHHIRHIFLYASLWECVPHFSNR